MAVNIQQRTQMENQKTLKVALKKHLISSCNRASRTEDDTHILIVRVRVATLIKCPTIPGLQANGVGPYDTCLI